MNFHTRKWVKPEDLNPNGTLFGGSLLRWLDEEAAIYAIVQLGNQRVVTKYISEINFDTTVLSVAQFSNESQGFSSERFWQMLS